MWSEEQFYGHSSSVYCWHAMCDQHKYSISSADKPLKHLIIQRYRSKPSSHVKLTFIGTPHAMAIAYFTRRLGIDGDCFCYNMKGFVDSCGLLGPAAVDWCPLSIRFASQSKSSSKQILNDIYASSIPSACTQGFYS